MSSAAAVHLGPLERSFLRQYALLERIHGRNHNLNYGFAIAALYLAVGFMVFIVAVLVACIGKLVWPDAVRTALLVVAVDRALARRLSIFEAERPTSTDEFKS